jgi:voltage-gated sodium channel
MIAPTDNPTRQPAGSGVTVDRAVTAVILANSGVLVIGLMVDGHEHAFEIAHIACLLFFVAELALRLRASRRRFFRDKWNCFDTAVIAASCLPVLGVDASLLRLARLARLVHLVRHISHLRLFPSFARSRAVRV